MLGSHSPPPKKGDEGFEVQHNFLVTLCHQNKNFDYEPEYQFTDSTQNLLNQVEDIF